MYSSSKFSSMMFSSLMVVVMLQMLLLQTAGAADMNLSVNPAHIYIGSSPSLDVNCTFSINSSSAMAEIISLSISRGNNTELASITDYSDHQVNVMLSEGISADGVINPGGISYIHLHWDYPTDNQKGTYQCSAQGMDLYGHISVVSETAPVIQDQINLVDLMNKMFEMDTHIQELDQRLSVNEGYTKELENYTKNLEEKLIQNENDTKKLVNYTRTLENYTKELEERLSLKEDYIKDLEQNVSDISTDNKYVFSFDYEEPFLAYGQKSYFVSKSPFSDINVAINDCKDYGGQLVELNDYSEYHAIRDYLNTLNIYRLISVYIGGTDEGHEGKWVLPSSGEELPVVDWCCFEDEAFIGGEKYSCLSLSSDEGWQMYSDVCHRSSENSLIRYMCEI